MDIEKFILRCKGFLEWSPKDQVDALVYYLTEEKKVATVTAGSLKECFDELSLNSFARLAQYLSEESKKRRGRYIKKPKGYILERSACDAIESKIGHGPAAKHASKKLCELEPLLKKRGEKVFLKEAISCYQIGAFRATIILVWILAIDHLLRYVYSNPSRLSRFNAALSKNPTKKIKKINKFDDLSELGEDKLIELMRASKIISNDVFKIIKEKLGTRNTAAHPSTVIISPHKTVEFVIDLIENVILKY